MKNFCIRAQKNAFFLFTEKDVSLFILTEHPASSPAHRRYLHS